jgi:hypothetical protein
MQANVGVQFLLLLFGMFQQSNLLSIFLKNVQKHFDYNLQLHSHG